MYEFIRLESQPDDWDEQILQYDAKTLFHESSWLDHLRDIRPESAIRFFEIRHGREPAGLHCGVRITKWGLPIHGSPLGGTGTNFMAFLVDKEAEQTALVASFTKCLGLREFAHVELANPWLDRSTMLGAGFTAHDGVTHLVRIPSMEEDAWAQLRSSARNRIRKAWKNDLEVERVDDERIVDVFFAQFQEVYGKQGMVTPFGVDRVYSLFRRLHGVGRLLPVWVRHGEDILARVVSTFDTISCS